MHLLAGETGRIDDGEVAVDLAQPPGDIVVLSAADSELAALAVAAARRGDDAPSLRLANLMQLAHPLSVDLYIDKTLSRAALVVVRMMGGIGYWPYGTDRLRALARAGGPQLAVIPGDARWDDSLEPYSTLPVEACRLIWRHLVEGGPQNCERALVRMAHAIGRGPEAAPPEILPHAGYYWPGEGALSLEKIRSIHLPLIPAKARTQKCTNGENLARFRGDERSVETPPIAALVFYRAFLQGGATAPIDALVTALAAEGIAALPIFVASLKERACEEFLAEAFAALPPAIVLNTTAFAVSKIGAVHAGTVLDRPGKPVLQIILAGSTEAAWRDSPRGLQSRDLTMGVVLPEVDGRLGTRAISFKAETLDPLTHSRTTSYVPVPDRVAFVARQAAAWIRLARKPAKDRRVAIVLSNYPNRDGRIANGVGLDTPESAARLAAAMREAGYDVANFPETGAALMTHLLAGQAQARRFVDAAPESSAATVAGGDASSPIGRGLPALASQGAKRPRRLGWKGEGFRLLRKGPNPSPFPPNLAPLAKAESPLPLGEDASAHAGSLRDNGARAATLASSPRRKPGSIASDGDDATSMDSGFRRNDEEVTLELAAYESFLAAIPPANRAAVTERWGAPEDDPFFADGAFRLAAHRFGNVVVAIQPGRGYAIDPKATYHDPALVPPHHYLAFYAWLREAFAADAMIQLGKHGNLEWLPGKALGLSEACWPEIALGALPLVYPFIVNDPGEGAQAKRRASAVIVDHLMPAMTRAEVHGGLAELETLIDEYYLAAGIDPHRRAHLEKEILAAAERHALDRDLGFTRADSSGALRALDAYLCELKEMQIRDGLHTLGSSPESRQRIDTLVAIARVSRSGGRPADQSLQRAIATDLGLEDFDPLDCDPVTPWVGPRPTALSAILDTPWRTNGDTVERIEALAVALVARTLGHGDPPPQSGGGGPPKAVEGATPSAAPVAAPSTTLRVVPLPRLTGEDPSDLGPRTTAVLDWIAADLASSLDASGAAEIAATLAALDGRFVPPGPSGAPTRGRPDVLPTGRNFYSVDVRAVPTAAAYALARTSADALALRYFQDEGEWPRSIAMSAWATSNMRTGGDDIAQVLALIGARPAWEPGTGRVTGFEIVPLSELGRPRIDVTLRISGMFRDAFPDQIDLIDSAVHAVAALAEPDEANPIAASVRAAEAHLVTAGLDRALAARHVGARIFGSSLGTYGAGLQALIDSGAWNERGDLAEAFVAWSSFAYGGGARGDGARDLLVERLKSVDAVFHAQDNLEHDILDSDDYSQFQGGLAAGVQAYKGAVPRLYHGDHSRPDRPSIRATGEQISRVVRGRAANPKWIAGMMRHGYKGAFEMAATVDFLFAYAATTDAVGDHHFDQLFDAYIGDPVVADFIAESNPSALAEMAVRFREAVDRGLWAPRSNSAYDRLSALISEAAE